MSKPDPHPEHKLGSIPPKELREQEKQLETTRKRDLYLRGVQDLAIKPEKPPKPTAAEERDHYTSLLEKLKGTMADLEGDYAKGSEKFEAELREVHQTLRYASKSSNVEKYGPQNSGVIPLPDSSKRDKDSDDLDDRGSKASDRQLKPQGIQDDLDDVYGPPNGQSPEALNRQFNSPEMRKAFETLNRWRDRLETTWGPDMMERARQFSHLKDNELSQKGIQDPEKFREEEKKLKRYVENSRTGQTVSVFDWEKTCSYLGRELRKLEKKADWKQAKL